MNQPGSSSRVRLLLGTILGCALLPASMAIAQAVNYMDESGNIHFADKVEDVPIKYRSQLIKPTPGPQNKEEYKQRMEEYKKRHAEEEKERKAREKLAEKERKIREREREKQAKIDKKESEERSKSILREQHRLAAESKSSKKPDDD